MKIKNPIVYCTFKGICKILNWLERYRIKVYAAQASFFITISALPFMILLLAVVGFVIPMHESAVKNAIIEFMPKDLSGFTANLINEISTKSSFKILSLSAITLFWSASRGIRAIGAGIKNVFCCSSKKTNIFKYALKSLLFTFLWIITVITTLIVWVFGDTIIPYAKSEGIYNLLRLLNSGTFILILTAIFAITYMGFSGEKYDFFSHIKGAAFSALGWFVFSRIFEFYLENYANYSYIYGSIASLIVVMLWIYFCMEILLIGAGINAFFRHTSENK